MRKQLLLSLVGLFLFSLGLKAEIYSGKCGSNVNWVLDTEIGLLTLSGSGDTYGYWSSRDEEYKDTPWEAYTNTIKTIIIEEGITYIGEYIFSSLPNLTSITIPESVTGISPNNFSITNLPVENGIRYADSYPVEVVDKTQAEYILKKGTRFVNLYTFSNCSQMSSIVIPNTVISIEGKFTGCSNLNSIIVEDGNQKYDSRNNCNAIVHTSTNWLIAGCNGTTVPESVERLEKYSLYYASMDSLVLPSTCTFVDDFALPKSLKSLTILRYSDYGYSGFTMNDTELPNLEELITFSGINTANVDYWSISAYVLKIPEYLKDNINVAITNSAKSIEVMPFEGTCGDGVSWAFDASTSTLTIKGNGDIGNYKHGETPWQHLVFAIKSIVIQNGITSIGDYAFSGCMNVTNVSISNSVTSIGAFAFEGLYALANITIPSSVNAIYAQAFSKCSALKSFTLPSSVTMLGDRILEYCTSLSTLSVNSYNSKYYSSGNCIIEKSSNSVVAGCKTSVIPNTAVSIGIGAFMGCSVLENIVIPNSVTIIGACAFYDCSSLSSIVLPNSVSSLGNWVFYGCTSLETLSIPENVLMIPTNGFEKCTSLKSIDFPSKLTYINNNAFDGCSSFKHVDLSNTELQCISTQAFKNCTSLESIKLPASILISSTLKKYDIGSSAFEDCVNLKKVTCYAATPPSLGTDVFKGVDAGNCELEIPVEAINVYSADAQWNKFKILGNEIMLSDGTLSFFSNSFERELNEITYIRTFSKPNTWNAFYVPFEIPMTAEFCQNYDVAYFNDIHSYDRYIGEPENAVLGKDGVIDGMDMEVLMVQEGAVLNANYPYLIRAKNVDALNMNINMENATLYKTMETTVSCSSVFMKFDVTGIYTTHTAGELKGEFDVYAMSGGGWKQALNPAQQLKPFRLYLKLTSIDGSPVKVSQSALSRINIRVDGEDTETSILEKKNREENKNEIFDLSGRRVQNTQKGLYIVNGKKVIR